MAGPVHTDLFNVNAALTGKDLHAVQQTVHAPPAPFLSPEPWPWHTPRSPGQSLWASALIHSAWAGLLYICLSGHNGSMQPSSGIMAMSTHSLLGAIPEIDFVMGCKLHV